MWSVLLNFGIKFTGLCYGYRISKIVEKYCVMANDFKLGYWAGSNPTQGILAFAMVRSSDNEPGWKRG